jgi:3-oxoacyl-[acyl-carrier-protein] synthase II
MPRSNAVITGLGIVSSIGIGSDAFWNSLIARRSGICSLAQRTDDGATPAVGQETEGLWIGGPILDFDAREFVRPRKALKVMCREIQTAFAASQLAINDADLDSQLPAAEAGQILPHQVGVVFGSEMFYGTPAEMVDAVKDCRGADDVIAEGQFGAAAMKNIMPLWMLKYLPNMPACHVGIAVNSHGPNNTLVLGDVSGPAATIEAASYIDRGIASVVIAGATGTRISTTRLNYRGNLGIAATYDPIQHSSRPHDPTSVGVVGGEGAAAAILESNAHATARRARVLARLVSHANCFAPSEAIRSGSPHAELGSSTAIATAIEIALRDAQLRPQDIGLVVSHGMGQPDCDRAEQIALRAKLPEQAVVAPIASIGHTGAAAGAMQLVTAVLAVVHQKVPPTIQVASTLSEIGLRAAAEPLRGSHALCLTHTGEGCATALVIGPA